MCSIRKVRSDLRCDLNFYNGNKVKLGSDEWQDFSENWHPEPGFIMYNVAYLGYDVVLQNYNYFILILPSCLLWWVNVTFKYPSKHEAFTCFLLLDQRRGQ